jgi:hypothetical protein
VQNRLRRPPGWPTGPPIMSTLAAQIQALTDRFSLSILEAIRSSSLEALLAEQSGGRGRRGRPPSRDVSVSRGKRARRGAEELQKTADRIVAYAKAHPGELGEKIRGGLRLPKNHWLRPLGLALKSGKLSKKGEKRATRYWAK